MNEKGKCPQCRSEKIEYDAIEIEGDVCYYPFVCTECHYEGKEWYSFEYIETN